MGDDGAGEPESCGPEKAFEPGSDDGRVLSREMI